MLSKIADITCLLLKMMFVVKDEDRDEKRVVGN